jgi:hypothetical protein
MVIQDSSFSFSPFSGSGPRVMSTSVTMPSAVTQATAILTGFIAEFSGGDDHHLGLLDIQTSVPAGGVSGAAVQVNITFGLRDWSGDWDDQYDGRVFFTVIGE